MHEDMITVDFADKVLVRRGRTLETSYTHHYIVEAIIASALMDHYVYPLDRWLDAAHVDVDHSHGINMCMATELGYS